MRKTLSPIKIDASIAVVEGSEEYENTIMNLGQINCFVGSNNSGKSRIMRHITMKFYREDTKLAITSTIQSLFDNQRLWLIKSLINFF